MKDGNGGIVITEEGIYTRSGLKDCIMRLKKFPGIIITTIVIIPTLHRNGVALKEECQLPRRDMEEKTAYVGTDTSTPWRPALNTGINTQSSLCKAFPQQTHVLAVCQHTVGLYDGVTGVEERGSTRLKFHSVEYESIS